MVTERGVENEKHIIPDGPSNVLIYNTKNVELFEGCKEHSQQFMSANYNLFRGFQV